MLHTSPSGTHFIKSIFWKLLVKGKHILVEGHELSMLKIREVDYFCLLWSWKNSRWVSQWLKVENVNIGIFPLIYSRIFLDKHLREIHTNFIVISLQTINNEIDYITNAIMRYKDDKHAIITCTEYNLTQDYFRKIGELGYT